MQQTARQRSVTAPAVIGIALIGIGALVLLARATGIDVFGSIGRWGWPAFIIVPGVVLLGLSLAPTRPAGIGFATAGAIVTTVGLLLAYQSQTGHWESWAYAWALVGPAASGLGLALWGLRSSNAGDVRNGIWGLLGGFAFFAIGFLFFEGLIGISGERLPLAEWVLPAAVIVIGVVVLMRGLLQRGNVEQP
jgi:hypothetical protein